METEFVRTAIAVIEERSIAAAARRLGLTAGAVALRVKTLESELGTSLIGRTGRSIAPTASAARLLPGLRAMVDQATDLQRRAIDSGGIAGELRLGTIATASTGMLPPLLCTLTARHPDLDVMIQPGTSLDLCERVLDGSLDAAIVVEPPAPLRKGERFSPWAVEPLVLIAPPACAGRDPISLLSSEAFIRYDRRNWGGRIVDRFLRTTGIVVRERIELDALDGIVAMVAAGLGVAIIPDWTGPRLEGAKVLTLPLPPPQPTRTIGLYSRTLSIRQDLIALVEDSYRTGTGTAGQA
ncbi:LysR substrate-binding domain-containing protein [Xanthobacter autotrophicus]|uniref:LysR substrate-binding domain-containing protein n=1 Tax=Xanthobacter autotrophicus TaxID=280 RepID=UPI00372C8195